MDRDISAPGRSNFSFSAYPIFNFYPLIRPHAERSGFPSGEGGVGVEATENDRMTTGLNSFVFTPKHWTTITQIRTLLFAGNI